MDEAYASAVVALPGIGEKIANVIDYLVENHGMSLDNTHLIGFSLGAHIVGFVGKNVLSGKIHTIIGLDPAIPLKHYDQPDNRLNSNDAQYVESIQTSSGTLGFVKPIGKVSFYPNGGFEQPECIDYTSVGCNHQHACLYYAEAVRSNSFPSMRCGSYMNLVNKTCDSQYSGVRMGDSEKNKLSSGVYYVPVHKTSPYGFGN
ncbi:phospholipase A1-like [Eurosta solidaginis]|uniref:phospholipase A1-like n=1 Tax=Eurosta solidaginis TaxID=178769 RepID=UPI003530A919